MQQPAKSQNCDPMSRYDETWGCHDDDCASDVWQDGCEACLCFNSGNASRCDGTTTTRTMTRTHLVIATIRTGNAWLSFYQRMLLADGLGSVKDASSNRGFCMKAKGEQSICRLEWRRNDDYILRSFACNSRNTKTKTLVQTSIKVYEKGTCRREQWIDLYIRL